MILARFNKQVIRPDFQAFGQVDRIFNYFIEELKEFNPNSQNTMVSFDVVSLFTNAPLVETINL